MRRRDFMRQAGMVSLGFMSLQAFAIACKQATDTSKAGANVNLKAGYGDLLDDSEGILQLPEGFSYKIISRQGTKMSDGFLLPGKADGMATFEGPNGKVIVVRNHEVSPEDQDQGPFGPKLELLSKLDKSMLYDYGKGELPGMGGTTTFVYNPVTQEIESEYLSLAGTIRNCAGGPTPWGSWITCEETTVRAGEKLEKDHGYNFEVPAGMNPLIAPPTPIKGMGRFNHEAVCVDPRTSIVYMTEDRGDGLIYRFIPAEMGQLHKGGKLQVLAIRDAKSFDTRNWADLDTERLEVASPVAVSWMDIEDIDAPDDDLRIRGFEQGAARFARGEGMWFGNNEMYFACTNGGTQKHGQVFRYTPSAAEGTDQEDQNPGMLELFAEPNNSELLKSCDNLTIAANGDIILCEDRSTPRIVGITQKGDIYHLAKNVGFESEFAGATFSPDGQTLFVNIQHAGMTLAITGPWANKQVA